MYGVQVLRKGAESAGEHPLSKASLLPQDLVSGCRAAQSPMTVCCLSPFAPPQKIHTARSIVLLLLLAPRKRGF